MSAQPGTQWTAAGEGATVNDLRNAPGLDLVALCRVSFFFLRHQEFYDDSKTNLSRNGRPLTAADCERILSDEFRVGV